MADSSTTNPIDLLDALPSYINGTAKTTQHAQIKQRLAADSQARAALAWHEALAEKVIGDVESVRGDIGWAQLQSRVRATQRVRPEPTSVSFWAKLEKLLPHHWLPAPALSGALAVLLAVVLGQGLVLHDADTERAYSAVRSTQTDSNTSNAALSGSKYIKVNFKEKTTERDMRMMLIRSGAVIVSGPGQLGDYIVAVPSADLGLALSQFKESLLTEFVKETTAPASASAPSAGITGSAPGDQTQSKSLKTP